MARHCTFVAMQPLDDLLVVDLSRVLAGPFATMVLSDYGARIVKVERPGAGDDTRGFGPPFLGGESAYFLSLNRNKESLAIDFSKPTGRALLERLIARADVVVENFRPGVLDKLGLGAAHLRERNPRLVYVSISGFGHTGLAQWTCRPGYDLVVQGIGGLMSVTGETAGDPMRVGLPIADLLSGLYAALGTLLALRARERTGRGQHVDVSMLDGVISILTYQAGIHFATGRVPSRLGNAHPTIVPYETLRASDGFINLAAANDAHFVEFCRAAGRDDLSTDLRFVSNPARVENRQALLAELAPLLMTRTVAQWLELLEKAGVPCGPILDISQALAHPQAQARAMVRELSHDSAGHIRVTGVPVRLSETAGDLRSAPPRLGEHTEAILRELGLSTADLDSLEKTGVVQRS